MADKFQLKAIISAQDKLSPTLKGIQKNIKITKKSVMDIAGGAGKLVKSLGIGALASGAGIFGVVKSIVGETAKFENFEAVLASIEGSAEAARKAITWVDKFSNETPYDLDVVVEAYTRLRGSGLDPTTGSLEAVANAAAGMNKPITDAANAFASALVGENDALKGFNISAQKSADKIYYTWFKNGKKMVSVAKANSRASIEATLSGMFNTLYPDAARNLSSTWDGMFSMMKGHYLNFLRSIGQSGVFDTLKRHMKSLMALVDKWTTDGSIERWAKQISTDLSAVIDQIATWLQQIDWAAAWDGLKSTIVGIRDFINAVGGLKTVLISIGVIMLAGPVASIFQIVFALGTLSKVVFGMIFTFDKATKTLLLTNPVMLAIVATLALVAWAAYKIIKQWDPLKGFWENLWGGIKAIVQDWWDFLIEVFSWNPINLILKAWGGVAKFFGKLYDQAHGITSGGPISVQTSAQNGGSGSPLSPRVQSMNRAQVNGEMTVKFENAPQGMRVSPGATNQKGMAFNPEVGYRSFMAPF